MRAVRTLTMSLICLGTIAACTGEGTSVMTTNDGAHRGVIGHLQNLADSLGRPGATLTVELPGLPNSEQTASPTPCGADEGPDQPYRWQFAMWVLIPRDSDAPRIRDAAASALRDHGWNVTTSASGTVGGSNADGYAVSILRNPDTVPLSVTSPCFPRAQLDRMMEWPRTIAAR